MMFWHNYRYRLKCSIRDKQMLFWTFLFPILLATLFNMAFANLSSAEQFSKINIAIVDNAEYKKNTDFQTALRAVSSSEQSTGKNNLFDVKYTSQEEADKLLEKNQIKGYIHFDQGIKLVVNNSGIDQTIIKAFIDEFQQTSSTISTLISYDPTVLQKGLLGEVSERKDYLKNVASGKSAPDTTVNYFYTVIAMACLYGSFWGLKEVVAIQANLSSQGARMNMAPTHKLKLFIGSMLAVSTVLLVEIFTLLAYLTFILNVNFGSQIGYIILTCIVGILTGVTFGAFIASVVKAGEGIKMGVLIGLSMTMSFLSGMMFDKMKYIVSTKVPILGYLNPANLITDSFYSLYYYDTHTQFFTDILILCGFIIFFCIMTYLVLRRQRYASL